jgi:hypothetical protein
MTTRKRAARFGARYWATQPLPARRAYVARRYRAEFRRLIPAVQRMTEAFDRLAPSVQANIKAIHAARIYAQPHVHRAGPSAS